MGSTQERRRVLSVTIDDCEVQTFRAGGNGGQNQNKRDTGVRIIHRASGARGESREHRTQPLNKRAAFKRMAATPTFRTWLARQLGQTATDEAYLAEAMRPDKVRVEHREGGRWVEG